MLKINDGFYKSQHEKQRDLNPFINAYRAQSFNESEGVSKSTFFSRENDKDESLMIVKDSQVTYFGEYIGQFANCYLLIEKDKNLYIVYQHAFHERILFEDILKAHKDEKILKQGLLNPMLIILNEYIVGLLKDFQTLITPTARKVLLFP